MSNSAVMNLALLGVQQRPGRPTTAEARHLRRHNERLEHQVEELERQNRRLRRELDQHPAAEPRERELEGLQRMSGAVGHVFNNLMTCIGCSADLIRLELPAASDGHRHLDSIDQAWKRAAEVCRRMSIAAGDTPLRTAELDLNELVREVEPVISAAFGKGVRARLRLGSDPVPVAGDATLLRQLLLELGANAAEALGPGPGLITISSQREPGRRARLEVRDDGPGMEPDQMAKIFDPFFSTKFLGRGLGLTAAFSIVERHHGEIRGSSRVGRGTTFQILLPAGAPDQGFP